MQHRETTAPRQRSGGAVSPTAATAPAAAPELRENLDDWPIWDDRDLARHMKRSVSRIQKDQAENNENAFSCVRIGRLRRFIPNVIREELRSRTVRSADSQANTEGDPRGELAAHLKGAR
jgi:hypothetical protein